MLTDFLYFKIFSHCITSCRGDINFIARMISDLSRMTAPRDDCDNLPRTKKLRRKLGFKSFCSI